MRLSGDIRLHGGKLQSAQRMMAQRTGCCDPVAASARPKALIPFAVVHSRFRKKRRLLRA